MIFKLVLKGFKLKKVECWAKRMAQPVHPVDRLCLSGRGPIEGDKKFLSLPVASSSRSRLNLNRLRSGRGLVEAQRSLFLTANRPVKPPTASLTFFYSIKRIKYSLFQELNLPKHCLNIFELWESVFECNIVLKLAYL